jgi:hypothetical protein
MPFLQSTFMCVIAQFKTQWMALFWHILTKAFCFAGTGTTIAYTWFWYLAIGDRIWDLHQGQDHEP